MFVYQTQKFGPSCSPNTGSQVSVKVDNPQQLSVNIPSLERVTVRGRCLVQEYNTFIHLGREKYCKSIKYLLYEHSQDIYTAAWR